VNSTDGLHFCKELSVKPHLVVGAAANEKEFRPRKRSLVIAVGNYFKVSILDLRGIIKLTNPSYLACRTAKGGANATVSVPYVTDRRR